MEIKNFIKLLMEDYNNHCFCISGANFGEKIDEGKYTIRLSSDCSLIRKEDGTKYIKFNDILIEMKDSSLLSEEEKETINKLREDGVFSQLELERWLEPKKETATHFWRTGVSDDEMQ